MIKIFITLIRPSLRNYKAVGGQGVLRWGGGGGEKKKHNQKNSKRMNKNAEKNMMRKITYVKRTGRTPNSNNRP